MTLRERTLPTNTSTSKRDLENEERSIKEDLLADSNIKRWFGNKEKRSKVVADVDLRRLGRFCKSVNLSPAEFAKLSVVKMEDVMITM